MKRVFCLIALSLAACESPAAHPAAMEDQAKRDVYWLADDAREGRLPGTPGADAAAGYVAQRFSAIGLKPVPSLDSFRQAFTVKGRTTLGPKTSFSAADHTFTQNIDYRPIAISATGTFAGKLAFVGYGAVSDKYQYDDYAGLDVKDRAVVAMRYEPHNAGGKSRFTNDEFSDAAPVIRKAQAAHSRGATALLLVNPPRHHEADATLRPFVSDDARLAESPIPIVSLTPQVAEKLIGRPLLTLQQQIDSAGKPASFLVDGPGLAGVAGEVDLQTQQLPTENVVGILEGTGPNKDEYVIIGAHYDHIGRGTFGSLKPESAEIHNGADDNASGVAALLAAAEQLAKRPRDRSIVFIGFSGEESGLIGSRFYVKNSPLPLEKAVAMLNLDMVGRVRNNTLFVGGGGTRPAFAGLLKEADAGSPLELKSIGEGGFGPSDHQSFAIKKIPVLFFFSGHHSQYHHPEDDAWRVNYDGLNQVAALTTALAGKLAEMPKEEYVGKFDHQWMGPTTTQPTTQPGGIGRASLGTVPDYGSDQSAGGVSISGTVPGSPAEQAGLKEGDVLVGLGDKPIKNLYDLTDILRKAAPGDELDLHYLRGGKKESVRVRLSERKGTN